MSSASSSKRESVYDLAASLQSPREERIYGLGGDGDIISLGLDANLIRAIASCDASDNEDSGDASSVTSSACSSRSPSPPPPPLPRSSVSMATPASSSPSSTSIGSTTAVVDVLAGVSSGISCHPSRKSRSSSCLSRASTVSETESLKLEEAVERLESVVTQLSARGGPSDSEPIASPFARPLSELDSHDESEPSSGNEDTEAVDTFPDSIFVPSGDNSTTSTVRLHSDRSSGSSGIAMATQNEESDYDPTKNPFSPYYRPTNKRPSVQPNPFECSSFVTDAMPIVPKLDFGSEQFNIAARPSEALLGLAKGPNPFRLEAWADRDVRTARPPTHEPVEDIDSELPHASPKAVSKSAPSTQRKYAPCAVIYPETDAFLSLVMGDFAGFMALDGTDMSFAKFYPDGCFSDEETALHCAAARGHIECVQCLVEAGADVNSQDQNGQTALHLALRRSHIDIALYLISRECNTNLRDANDDTPLHVACRLGLNSVVQMLSHLGAEVGEVNAAGDTPLHIAAKEGHIEIVRCLCYVGADTQAKNRDGLTPEIVALTREHLEISNLLSKLKSESVCNEYVKQLCSAEIPLRRIKLKMFGNSNSGKTRLIHALHDNGVIGNLINAVSRRFSDNSPQSSPSKGASDEGIHSCASSSASSDSTSFTSSFARPAHPAYTHGIDVQVVSIGSNEEFSVWEFGGYDPYHISYDHFVGNTDCIHIITLRADDPTEVQYHQALYWMNFLKGRVTPSEPIGHRGIIARRSKVVIVATHATASLLSSSGFEKTSDGNYTNSDAEAMMQTIRLRFESHFDVYERIMFIDSTNNSCTGLKFFKEYLRSTREDLLSRLQRPLILLDRCIEYLAELRKRYHNFPVITWLHYTNLIREEVNPLVSDSHCQQIIHQLQHIGEVIYLRDEAAEIDYVVITPEWLGTHVLGTILSADFLSSCRENGTYSADDFSSAFPEVNVPTDLMNILDTLHLCAPMDPTNVETSALYEFPAFLLTEPPRNIWSNDKPGYVYGGLRVLPMRGMESTLQSTFPRLQVAMRKQLHDYQDPAEVTLHQWQGVSKLTSSNMEALVRLVGDAVEVQVRGPQAMATSCIYFFEDVVGVIEQTTNEIAPGMALERHFLSPKHLRDHVSNPASFPPEVMMEMQQREQLSIVNSDGEEELFTDVVCFGSREVAAMLTLGIDMSVSQLTLPSRCELAALLDPPDAMGRDWSILAVKLNLAETVEDVDKTGHSISQTDQLISEWSIKAPESASVGKFCAVLDEMGRADAKNALYRTVPLYMFAPLEDTHLPTSGVITSHRDTATSIADSGVLLSSAPRSTSTLSN
uniref:Non-specific serine/threonine protein kinase n=1 Tax=Panagrellus redivivus TaxID=6233 RepID=A0A7E4VSP6_PANRE